MMNKPIIIVLGFRDYLSDCFMWYLGEQLSLQKYNVKYCVHNTFFKIEEVLSILYTEENWRRAVGLHKPTSNDHIDIGKIEEWSFVLSAPCCVTYDMDNTFHITMLSMPIISGEKGKNLSIYRNAKYAVDLLEFGQRLVNDYVPQALSKMREQSPNLYTMMNWVNIVKSEFNVIELRKNSNFAHIAGNDDVFLNTIFDMVLNNTLQDLHTLPREKFAGLTLDKHTIFSVYMYRMIHLTDNSRLMTFHQVLIGRVVFNSYIFALLKFVKEMKYINGPLSGIPYTACGRMDDFLPALAKAQAVLVGSLEDTDRSTNFGEDQAIFVANKWVAFAIEDGLDESYAHFFGQKYKLYVLTIIVKRNCRIGSKATITTRCFEDLQTIDTVFKNYEHRVHKTLYNHQNVEMPSASDEIIIVLGFNDYKWNCFLKRLGEYLSRITFTVKYYVYNKFEEVKDIDLMISSEENWQKAVGLEPTSDDYLDISRIHGWSFVLSPPCCVNYDRYNGSDITVLSLPQGEEYPNLTIYRHDTAYQSLIYFGQRMEDLFIPMSRNISGPHLHPKKTTKRVNETNCNGGLKIRRLN